jgi:myo-inositol-1(or 4)-monophosphatase
MTLRSAIINVMTAAARKAARNLLRDFGEVENLQVSRKGPADFVSAADRRAEDILHRELARARPGFGFLMEERGAIAGTDGHDRWIVDPLDGTTNFLHGIPHFCISIAHERDGEVLAGVIYEPLRDEMFWAERGMGAHLNDRRLRVSARERLGDAVAATGIPHIGRPEPAAFLDQLADVMDGVAGVRRFGSAALDLAYVASGRFDAFWETGLSAWDVAAGVVIVREAGGMVSTIDGSVDVVGADTILAANAGLHRAFGDLLRAAKTKT